MVILNKKFFNKKKLANVETPAKTLAQSECLAEKKPISAEKKKNFSNKLNNSAASPATSKQQKKETNKIEENLAISEKMESSQQEIAMKQSENSAKIAEKSENLLRESKKIEPEVEVPAKIAQKTACNLKKNPQNSKKAKKNKEILDNLVEKACETQVIEKKFVEDMQKIEECVYLTKLKNTNSAEKRDNINENQESDGDSAKIKKIMESSFDINKNYRENFDLSPESLARKYEKIEEKSVSNSSCLQKTLQKSRSNEKKRFYSPNTSFKNNNTAVNNCESTAVLLENEVWRYVKNYENQINYLKLMVYALDKKLAVF